jgi:hypothetical protein
MRDIVSRPAFYMSVIASFAAEVAG